jgi:hypothetical protein
MHSNMRQPPVPTKRTLNRAPSQSSRNRYRNPTKCPCSLKDAQREMRKKTSHCTYLSNLAFAANYGIASKLQFEYRVCLWSDSGPAPWRCRAPSKTWKLLPI